MIRKRSDFGKVSPCGKLCMNFHPVTMKDTCIDFWSNLNVLLKHQIKLALSFKAGCIFWTHCTKIGCYMCQKA